MKCCIALRERVCTGMKSFYAAPSGQAVFGGDLPTYLEETKHLL
jgi:hypothetical protein